MGHRQRATGVAGNHGMNERVGGIGVGNRALLTDEVEDDAIVREPHRGVVEVGLPLWRHDADPHHCCHAARVAVGDTEVE